MVVRDSAPVASQTLNLVAGQPALVTQRGLDWGHYRLDVTDPSTGVAASVRFTAGWFEGPSQSDTPDQMKVTLDKPRYQAGETAKIFLRAPFAGQVLLNVVGDRLWSSKTVSAPAEGTTVELPIPAEWGPGVYIAATAFRAADHGAPRGPGPVSYTHLKSTAGTVGANRLQAAARAIEQRLLNSADLSEQSWTELADAHAEVMAELETPDPTREPP